MWEAFYFVGVLGLEPRMTGPESVVLPLHHTPKSCNQNILVFVLRVQRYYFFINLMKELVQTITEAIQEKKGSNIVIADLRKIEGTISQYFIICQGNSPSQVEAITESVGDFARERLKEKPSHVVGLENAQWVAMDYGDVLVHIFLPDVREYYDLEHLWEDAALTRIPDLD